MLILIVAKGDIKIDAIRRWVRNLKNEVWTTVSQPTGPDSVTGCVLYTKSLLCSFLE